MTPERWRQVEELYHAVVERTPDERDRLLKGAPEGVRREVESLLAQQGSLPDVAEPEPMITRIALGGHVGPYRIEAMLGEGGMGEVFRAIDTRLGRSVAIKFAHEQFTARFGREAHAISSLNHPNICTLYDVGSNYLVMELVEGPTLADRIEEGAVPLEEALAVARQIAGALEAAHENGIVHRDLKPGNVKIKPDGTVKVLDFGLAKVVQPVMHTGLPDSGTLTIQAATRPGVILGTPAYMSPEQASGKPVDKRADIWAFGVVLYEMLSGKPAYHGRTTSDILAAVLKEEPDWSRIPVRMQPLLRRCLVKDPKHRLRDIGDAMLLFDSVPELAPALHPLVRLSVELSPGTTLNRSNNRSKFARLALSSDGTRIAIIEQVATGKFRLATRRLDESELVPLAGTEGATMPFFSPDGQWIGFFADGKLKKVAVQGGASITLCDAHMPMGASWGDDDNIIAALNVTSGLSRIPSGGGAPTPVTAVIREKGEVGHAFPQVLPGSHAVLFGSGPDGPSGTVDVLLFRTNERKTLQRGVSFGRYLSSGHLVYMQLNTLFAAPFDLRRMAVTGAPQSVLQDVSFGWNADFSQTGTMVYVSGKELPGKLAIFWLDSAGKAQPLHLTPGFYFSPRFSPDGKRLAFSMYTSTVEGDVWVKDLERNTTSRLTALPGQNGNSVWAPDSKSIVFGSWWGTAPGMYWIRADGTGEPQRLTESKTIQWPCSFSPDSKRLAYLQAGACGHMEIWTAPFEGVRDPGAPGPRLGKAEPFLRTPLSEGQPTYSPDGLWLAYSSNETGTDEVYVRPVPGPGGRTPISTGGARFPVWSRNGRKLFFVGPDERIMVVGYTAKRDSFAVGKPRVWSPKSLLVLFGVPSYDLAPDGKRFAVVLYPGGTAEQEPKPMCSVTVLLNFFDELRRRVPTGGK